MPGLRRTITDARTLRAMAHPLRLAIMEQLTIHGPLTASAVGDRLDETPANCSWHLRKLAEHGFVEEAAGGTGRQRPWQVTHLGMVWGEEGEGRTIGADEAMAGQALSDVLISREVDRLRDSQVRVRDDDVRWRVAAASAQSMLWLTADELEEINLAVRDLFLRHLDRHQDPALRPPGARLCGLVAWGVPTYGLADEVPADAPAQEG